MGDNQDHVETVYLLANNAKVGEVVSHSTTTTHTWDHVTARTIVHLQAGQQVYAKKADTHQGHYYGHMYLTFTGFLIKAD